MKRLFAFVCGAAALIFTGPALAADAPLPVETFYRFADMRSPLLSPSGRKLAVARATPQGRTVLAVIDLKDLRNARVVAAFDDQDVHTFHWVSDERLVFDIADLRKGAGKNQVGNALFAVNADGSEARQLIEGYRGLASAFTTQRGTLPPLHQLLAIPLDRRNEVIVARQDLDADGALVALTPMRLDTVTRRTRSLATGAPDFVTLWWFDPAGEPRAAAGARDGRLRVHWRAKGEEKWRQILDAPVLETPWSPAAVDAAGTLYVTVNDGPGKAARLKRYDFATNAPESDALVSTPGFDFAGGFVFDPDAGFKTLGLRYETDAAGAVWFDAAMKQAQERADARLPGRVNWITCRRCGRQDAVIFVESWSDREPGEYWLHEPGGDSGGGKWQRIGRAREEIDPRKMATLDFHRVKARDGLEIPVWVTLPAGAEAKKPRPAVVLIHGGPWVRGTTWGWSDDAQFFASRGYAVIEPEIRSSTGYGDAWFRAGFKQWGRAMQDDVADATQWAISQGFADKDRICLAGASYGGYATYMGLARHGEMYRCGVAWVAVSDHRLLFELRGFTDVTEQLKQYTLPQMIGDPKAEAALFAEYAPVELAGKIKKPLLIAMGEDDVRVPLVHGTKMRAALRAAGNEPEYVVYAKEGHGWVDPKNRYDWARRMEAFFAKHLK